MKLTLLMGQEEKTFTIPFVNGMVFRKFIEYKQRMNMTDLSPDELDELVGLVVYAFKDQFTLEQFYEGIPHDKVMSTIDDLFLPTDKGQSAEGNEKK